MSRVVVLPGDFESLWDAVATVSMAVAVVGSLRIAEVEMLDDAVVAVAAVDVAAVARTSLPAIAVGTN